MDSITFLNTNKQINKYKFWLGVATNPSAGLSLEGLVPAGVSVRPSVGGAKSQNSGD